MIFSPGRDRPPLPALWPAPVHREVATCLAQAARLHREAAKLQAIGETLAADLQVTLARYQLTKVASHIIVAGRPLPALLFDSAWHVPPPGPPRGLQF